MRIENDDLVRLSNKPVVCDRCECGGSVFVFDYHEATATCADCGRVDPEWTVSVPDFSTYNSTGSFFRRPTSYQRRYHFHERLAQADCLGPTAPAYVVEQVYRRACSLRGLSSRALGKAISQTFIKAVCKRIGAGKFVERWIWIRRTVLQRLCQRPGDHVLGSSLRAQLCDWFNRASSEFDFLLFVARGKEEARDCATPRGVPGSLQRHNFLNYNFAIHCILLNIDRGLRRKINAHFFFPLLRTRRVLERNQQMWTAIADREGWFAPQLAVILHKSYAYDWD